jgi:hypothetical protein
MNYSFKKLQIKHMLYKNKNAHFYLKLLSYSILYSLFLFFCLNLSAQDFCIQNFKVDTTYLTYFQINNKFGMIDYKGNIVIKPIYVGIDDFSSGYVIALKNEKDLVIINSKGDETATLPDFLIKENNLPNDLKVDWDLSFKDSLFLYFNTFYTSNGTIAKKTTHDFTCSNFNNGLALVADRLIDESSKKLKCFYGYVNKSDEIKFPVICEEARPFYNEFAAIKLKGKWGYINKNCSINIKPTYDEAFDFNEGYAIVKTRDTISIIDTLGKCIIKLSDVNTNEWYFSKVSCGLYPIKKNNQYGFINLKGEYIIPPIFEDVIQYDSNQLSSVKLNNKWGVIDKNGFIVVDFISNNPIIISQAGICTITYDSYYTYVDYKGNILKKTVYE